MEDVRTNQRIKAREIRLIGSDGKQLGVFRLETALAKAASEGLDLVEIQPNSKPPVCKIMDHGKWKYEEKKKASEAARTRPETKVKEIKLTARIQDNDMGVKLNKARELLSEGFKVKLTLVYQGREITHKDLGNQRINEAIASLSDVSRVDQSPKQEGKFLFAMLSPKNHGHENCK